MCATPLGLLLVESEYLCREIDIGVCEAHGVTPAYAGETAKEKCSLQCRVLTLVMSGGKAFDFIHCQYLFFQRVHVTVDYDSFARILFHQSFFYRMENYGSEHIV